MDPDQRLRLHDIREEIRAWGEISAEERGNHTNPQDEMSKEEKEFREQLVRFERDVEMAEKVLEPILCRLRCNWEKRIHATFQLKPSGLFAANVEGSVFFTNVTQSPWCLKDTIDYLQLATMRADLGLSPLHGLFALFPETQVYKERCHLKKLREQLRSCIQNSWYHLADAPSPLYLQDPTLYQESTPLAIGVQREIPLEEIEEAAEKSHPEFLLPIWLTPFVPPGTNPLPGIYPPGYRGGEY